MNPYVVKREGYLKIFSDDRYRTVSESRPLTELADVVETVSRCPFPQINVTCNSSNSYLLMKCPFDLVYITMIPGTRGTPGSIFRVFRKT